MNLDLTPELYDIARQLALAYKNELINVNAVATGNLSNFDWDIQRTGNSIKLVFFLPEYWQFIEEGRNKTRVGGTGQVRNSIKDWIRVKGIKPYPDSNGRTPTMDQLAYLISRKIHNKGFEGRQPLRKAMQSNKSLLDKFSEIAAKTMVDEIDLNK